MSTTAITDLVAAELNAIDPPAPQPAERWGQGVDIRPTPPASTTTEPAADGPAVDPTWMRVELGPVLAGEARQPSPEYLTRDDGRSLFYPGQVNGIHADSGTGKGWLTCHATAEAIREGLKVMIIDLEDIAESITARLRILGLTDQQIEHGVDYRRPQVGFDPHTVTWLCNEIADGGHAIVFLDSLGEAFALDGINEDKDNEVGPWLRANTRPIAETGAALVIVDHSTKAGDNSLHPSGSKRKRAAITGASYLIEATKPLTKEAGGRLKITCAKDRHGNFGRGEHVANFVMTPADPATGGPAGTTLYAPDTEASAAAPDAQVRLIAAKFVRMVRDSAVPLNKSMALEMVPVKARSDTKRAGLDFAINSGALTTEPAPRGALNLVFVKEIDTP